MIAFKYVSAKVFLLFSAFIVVWVGALVLIFYPELLGGMFENYDVSDNLSIVVILCLVILIIPRKTPK